MGTLLALSNRLPPLAPQLALRGLRAAAVAPAGVRYLLDRRRYSALPGAERLRWRDSFPKLGDRLATTPYDSHYLHQDTWAARRIAEQRPERHVDVGSRIDFVCFLSALTEVVFVDIRPLEADVDRVEAVAGSVLAMPFPDQSLPSVSCLHVAEHIGLGRYGDPLDPTGTQRAISELQRVVAPGGHLLFSLPVGRSRVCFNAHRIHDPERVRASFDELDLREFAGVDDAGRFRRLRSIGELSAAAYGCGMFHFTRGQRG